MHDSPAIDVVELTKFYGSFCAVDKISFQVQPGQIFGLLGPNGAGKSTTLKMLTTLLPPSSGTAKILGSDIVKNPTETRRKIGYVPQLLSADGDLTAYENLSLSAKLYGLSSSYRKQRIAEVLEFMGLLPNADQLVSQFSGGMIRRLEIAQALLHKPDVLFLDEPTTGLDPSARSILWNRIQDWRKNFHTAILITTHDMDEADKECDWVAFLHHGQIVVQDTPEKLKKTISASATLDDVFIKYTESSMEKADFTHVWQTRRTHKRLG